MAGNQRVADDFRQGIGPVTEEIYGEDNRANRLRIYHQLRLPEGQRLKGLFKISDRRVACVPSVIKADLLARSGLEKPDPSHAENAT
jgi:hypothetical protein